MGFRRGFTLVELMIVVAIIGILAAIAIPSYVTMQYRAKRAELPPNLKAISTAELAYEAAFDGFLAVPSYVPDATPGKTPRDWVLGSNFDTLGWRPDGAVRGSYRVQDAPAGDFTADAISDIDADGVQANFDTRRYESVNQLTSNEVY